jgi:hypothetical protein
VKIDNKGNEEAEKKYEDKGTGEIIVFTTTSLVEAEEGIIAVM